MKRRFGLPRTRYFGRAKVHAQMVMAAIVQNLLKAAYKLKLSHQTPKTRLPAQTPAGQEGWKITKLASKLTIMQRSLVVKNMPRIDRETIALISNNPIYRPCQVCRVDIGPAEEVDIIGRVVASMHEWLVIASRFGGSRQS